jgi:cell division protein FtsZ
MKITQGLGAGARPEIGRAAAEETLDQLETSLEGAHMCFIAAGMGGGTGTGAAPVVARAAREKGILTVGVVTKPFTFEGAKRMRAAEDGIAELQKVVDTLIVIPNQNLFLIANASTSLIDAFAMADQVLHQGVRGITDLMILPGLINLDFADIRTVMSEMGKAMMGTGEASGEGRALAAAEKAIANPLLDEVSMRGAKGVIINITGGPDLTLMEVDEAATHIRDMVDPDANIIVGSAFNKDLEGTMRVSVVATGIDAASRPEPVRAASGRTRNEPVFATQPSIFAAPPSITPGHDGTPVTSQLAPKPEVAATAPEPPVADDVEEIDLGAFAERLNEEEPPVETYRFTPAAPVVPIASARPATPQVEERAPTLFEKMMGLSGRSTPRPSAPATLAPEPEARQPDVEIPPFFKRQVNN